MTLQYQFQEIVPVVFHNENVCYQHILHRYLKINEEIEFYLERKEEEDFIEPRPLNATIFGLYILIFCARTAAPAVISSL